MMNWGVPGYPYWITIFILKLSDDRFSRISDERIASAYSAFCENNYAASWLDIDINVMARFGAWFFNSPFVREEALDFGA